MRTLIGLFEDNAAAKSSMDALLEIGAPPADFSLLSRDGGEVGDLQLDSIDVPGVGRIGACGPMVGAITRSTATLAADAIADALVAFGLPASEAKAYVDGVRRGYTLVAVTVMDEKAPLALQIMKDHSIHAHREGARTQPPPRGSASTPSR